MFAFFEAKLCMRIYNCTEAENRLGVFVPSFSAVFMHVLHRKTLHGGSKWR